MNKPRKERFIGLEWLRFLLGLYVVVYHTLHAYPTEQKFAGLDELTSLGFFATSTFFVLSGFLLAHVYIRDGKLRESPRSFLTKRFSNLYPIHLFSILLTILVLFLISHLGIGPDLDQATPRFVMYDTHDPIGRVHPELFRHWMSDHELLLNSILQLTMLQAWNPYYLTFNAPLWSLSTLFFFYLCFPFVAPWLMRVRHKWAGLLLVCLLYLVPSVVLVLSQRFGMPWTGLIHRNPLLRLPEFLGGILAYGLFREQKDRGQLPAAGTVGLLAACIAGSFLIADYLYTRGGDHWYFLLHNGLLLPAQLVLVYLCAMPRDPKLQLVRDWSPRLGAASLSLFALHVPLFTLFSRGEKLIRAPGECLADWAFCVESATQQQLSLWLYPLFLLFMVVSCVLFQERLVAPVRKWLVSHLLPPPFEAHPAPQS
ncbi:acyltransferase family protein [Pseudomonas panipatensis]|uniref:Peptidoglycan/LPS O-acetylase OafA/YrhL, contains acyltransferase and SGNH-hydrolase domains n=1 Tax=Pseudomonas panipatensis TaxID=428992 RepID=A0A1G8MIA9_9PSED|nr:acyltransferase [Pseudomonas panipatensis]SDI67768.1 Peptidoglycan/LPS O-acetylase OafA/YrhL, contains acyltransferase and SGNH-hydrolase domains [Pseudomonas panipatensis]SMP77208.1 Peptidoglycan/LPS O-acetylase OafA/YrhL, contains acyltransferase and SGNH-hydrolase domains [Pseudomonas panipatensis]